VKRDVLPRDAELAAVDGTNPRKVKSRKGPSWQQKLMGGMYQDEAGKWKKSPEKEGEIEAFTAEYGDLRGLWRIRVPDCILRAVYGRGALLDRLVEASHKSVREEYRTEAFLLRVQAKKDLADKPDDIFLDPKPLPDGTHRALVIENKTKAGKLSKGQRDTNKTLGGMHVTRSSKAVKAAIDAFCDHAPIPKE
jgi:hypothetical protein